MKKHRGVSGAERARRKAQSKAQRSENDRKAGKPDWDAILRTPYECRWGDTRPWLYSRSPSLYDHYGFGGEW